MLMTPSACQTLLVLTVVETPSAIGSPTAERTWFWLNIPGQRHRRAIPATSTLLVGITVWAIYWVSGDRTPMKNTPGLGDA